MYLAGVAEVRSAPVLLFVGYHLCSCLIYMRRVRQRVNERSERSNEAQFSVFCVHIYRSEGGSGGCRLAIQQGRRVMADKNGRRLVRELADAMVGTSPAPAKKPGISRKIR